MKIDVGTAERIAADLLGGAGLSEEKARKTARALAVAEAWRLSSHGLLRLPTYLDRFAAGGFSATAELRALVDNGPMLVFDGEAGIGHWQLSDAATEASRRAETHGIAAVGVSNSGHCGALGVYASDMAREGKIGLLFSSGPPVLPPWEGDTKLLSTSPIAAAFPIEGHPAIIDLALSTVARGKIAAYAKSGSELPDGWALDAEGAPTNDPAIALTGMLSPLGGAKGYALAFMVEALTAGLFGPVLSAEMPDFFDQSQHGWPQQIAHFVIALDPSRTVASGNPAEYNERIRHLAKLTEEAGGRVPGSRRTPPDTISPDEKIDIADDVWHDLRGRHETLNPR